MNCYAYNNPNSALQQLSSIIPYGIFAGSEFTSIITAPSIERKKSSDMIPARNAVINRILDTASQYDTVITSSLTNFSLDFISSIQIIAVLASRNIRVIAYDEGFDTDDDSCLALISAFPIMNKFRISATEARSLQQKEGIAKAVAEGKYKGRQAYSPSDFPNFRELYEQYMYREIGKGTFADKLGVSRPTLERLIEEFTKKKGT